MAMACFRGFPSLTRREILSLIFCFCERRIFLRAAMLPPVSVVVASGRDTSPEPSPRLQESLLPVASVVPAMDPSSKLLGGRLCPTHRLRGGCRRVVGFLRVGLVRGFGRFRSGGVCFGISLTSVR